MSLKEIFQLYDESWDRETDDVKRPYFEIPQYFAYIFHLIPMDIANKCLEPEMAELHKRIDELEKNFKTHRHDASKLYTEKPAW